MCDDRGSGPDIGVALQTHPVSHRPGLRVQTDSANFGENVIHRDPTFTDMYIIYSTVEGEMGTKKIVHEKGTLKWFGNSILY